MAGENEEEPQTTLRDSLEQSFKEFGGNSEQTAEVAKETEQTVETPKQTEQVQRIPRPNTWKKEHEPLWDKLADGQQLTGEEARRFLEYSRQRETEFTTGVTTYKAEADNARVLQEAVAPFLPELRQHGINPAQWIGNLGTAHRTLAMGNDQQRLEMFLKLADDYKVPLKSLLGGESPSQESSVYMDEIGRLKGEVERLSKWTRGEEESRATGEIERLRKDQENFPHFEQARETMARLLETGVATSLDEAYKKAIRLDEKIWEAEQTRLSEIAKKKSQVEKAKSAMVSPKSGSPVGKTQGQTTTDIRSLLAQSLEDARGGRI